jgi:hypothetical protein
MEQKKISLRPELKKMTGPIKITGNPFKDLKRDRKNPAGGFYADAEIQQIFV